MSRPGNLEAPPANFKCSFCHAYEERRDMEHTKKTQTCGTCGEINDLYEQYCEHCGHILPGLPRTSSTPLRPPRPPRITVPLPTLRKRTTRVLVILSIIAV